MLKNFKISTKIGASFALGLLIIATLAIFAYTTTRELIITSRWQNHTYEVIRELNTLIANVKEAEATQQAYLITEETIYLEQYKNTIPEIQRNLNHLLKLTADNPKQQQRLALLKPLISQRIARMQQGIALRQNQGLAAVKNFWLTNQGVNESSQIRQLVAEIEGEELQLLKQRTQQTQQASQQAIDTIIYGSGFAVLFLTLIAIYLTKNISQPLQEISKATEKLAQGDLSQIHVSSSLIQRQDEIGTLARALKLAIANLHQTTIQNNEQNWLQSNIAKFSRMLQSQRNPETLARTILKELALLLNAQQGVFYFLDSEDDQPVLKPIGTYAHQQQQEISQKIRPGEGLVGQCALEKQKIILTDIPSDYIRISSGLGEAKPRNIVILPVIFENNAIAVIELASFQQFSELHHTFLEQVSEIIGIALNAIAADIRTQQLLEQSQALTQQLQQTNKRLEQQTQQLQLSEEILKQQQQELQQSNEELEQLNAELEEKAELLWTKNQEIESKNQEIAQAKQALEEKAQQLALSSRYKSEFLANVSHELRTPLNSLLILAKLLADNTEGNLSQKQVEYSRTIYSAGNDLLSLINDILDLAKIESGTMSIEMNHIQLYDLHDNLERTFREVAQNKGLHFSIELAPELPKTIYTDGKRLQQVLRNLLANAFKFTERGEVRLRVFVAKQGWSPDQENLNRAQSVIAFAVSDTGIGIVPEKQKLIFEAFQQADGTTSRKYGGTGLGLSISREITRLLSGEITLESHPGKGSTFTLYLPQQQEYEDIQTQPQQQALQLPSTPVVLPCFFQDDRNTITQGDRILLIIEDDVKFARVLVDIARQYNFKSVVAPNGSAGLALARQYNPCAIVLDVRLPEIDGWTVLDRLKQDPNTRHIPVHVMTVEEGRQRSLQQGAIAYSQKPVSSDALHEALTKIKDFVERRIKNLLIVEDDENQRQSIVELIGEGDDVATTAVSTGKEALAAIRSQNYDCVVLDLGLPDMDGFELIEQIKQFPNGETLPVIVYTARELTRAQETQLQRLAKTIIIKDVRSPERLLDETALFLHRVQANLPAPKPQIPEQLHQSDSLLKDKKVLIIDDDVRNIFAITSVLERYQMQVFYAENGSDGIEVLQNHPDINIVLMDIMMPKMDGYETTRRIRQNPQLKSIPIIALTAKAMQGDREKCIEAGASDYITKPVDTQRLLSLLRVWLYRQG